MIIAVDTGGTKTLIAGYGEDGKIVTEFKFPTPLKKTEYVETLTTHLTALFEPKNVDAIVIALPGIVKNGIAVWCNNLHWKNFDVAAELKGVLGGAPLFVENDANLAGLAETRQLKNLPVSSLYVTISTGIGAVLSQTEKSTQDFAIARPAVRSSSSTVPSANGKPSPLAKQSTTPTESTRATLKANESGAKLPTA